MAIEFDCPGCGATVRVRDDAAGKTGRCPNCRALLVVPDPGPAEPAAPPIDVPITTETSQTAAAPPSPVADDPGTPFPIVTTPRPSPVIARRRRRGGPAKGMTIAVALIGLGAVVATGWFLLRTPGESQHQAMTGERLESVTLPSVTIASPGDEVPQREAVAVMGVLATDGLPLKSEFVEVNLTVDEGEIRVAIAPGPQSIAVRVPLGSDPALRNALAGHREEIAAAKQAELKRSTANLFRDYAAYLESGTPMTRLPEYRDKVALNAAVGIVGYAVEAIVGRTPFPCVYEDSEGNGYFFPPEGTQTFRVRGRQLADGLPPLGVQFEVRVVDAPVQLPVKKSPAESETSEPAQGDAADPTDQ